MDILLEFILNEDKCEAQTFQMRCERISSRLIYLNWKRVYFSVEFCACSFVYRTQSASPERVHSLSLYTDVSVQWNNEVLCLMENEHKRYCAIISTAVHVSKLLSWTVDKLHITCFNIFMLSHGKLSKRCIWYGV